MHLQELQEIVDAQLDGCHQQQQQLQQQTLDVEPTDDLENASQIDAEVESKSEMQRRSVARMAGLSGNAEADCKREQDELGRRITVRGKMVDELAQEMSDMRVGLEKVLGSRMTGARPRAPTRAARRAPH